MCKRRVLSFSEQSLEWSRGACVTSCWDHSHQSDSHSQAGLALPQPPHIPCPPHRLMTSRDLKEKQGFLWEVGPCPPRPGQRNVRRKLNFAGGWRAWFGGKLLDLCGPQFLCKMRRLMGLILRLPSGSLALCQEFWTGNKISSVKRPLQAGALSDEKVSKPKTYTAGSGLRGLWRRERQGWRVITVISSLWEVPPCAQAGSAASGRVRAVIPLPAGEASAICSWGLFALSRCPCFS